MMESGLKLSFKSIPLFALDMAGFIGILDIAPVHVAGISMDAMVG